MGIMNFNEIMDRSIEILKKQLKNIAPFMLCFSIIIAVIVFFIIALMSVFMFASLSSSDFSDHTSNLVKFIIWGSIIGILVGGISMGLNAGIIKITNRVILQEKASLGDAMSSAFHGIPKFWGIAFLIVMMFLPAAVAFGVIIYYLYKLFMSSGLQYRINNIGISGALLIAVFVIVVLAAFFVVLIYNTLFGFAVHAIIIENKSVIGSIKRSLQLVKGAFWKLLCCNLLIMLTVLALKYSLTSFAGLLFSILYLIMKFLNVSVDTVSYAVMCYSALSQPINLICLMMITPIGSIMTTLLYFNQRFKKEGYDIQLKVNELQRNNERKQFGGYYNNYYYPNHIR